MASSKQERRKKQPAARAAASAAAPRRAAGAPDSAPPALSDPPRPSAAPADPIDRATARLDSAPRSAAPAGPPSGGALALSAALPMGGGLELAGGKRRIDWQSTTTFLLLLAATIIAGVVIAYIAASYQPLVAAAAIVGLAVGIRFVTQPFYALMVTMLFIPMDALDRYFPPSLSAVKLMSLVTIGCFALYWLVFSEDRKLLQGTVPKLILLFITLGLIGSFFASYPGESLDAVFRVFRLFLLVLLVRNLVDTPQRARWLILALMIGVCISAGVGLRDLLTTHLKNFRPMGLTQQPNKFGNDTAQMVPVAIAMMWGARSKLLRLLYGGAAALLFTGVVISLSRGSLIGLLAVLPLLLWRLGGRHRLTIFAVIGVVVVVAFPIIPPRYYDRFLTVSDPNEDFSVMRRQTYLIFAQQKFIEHPFIGIGLSNFEELYVQSEYRILLNEHDKEKGRPAHNMYMHLTVETGVFGIAIFMTLLFWAWYELRRSQAGFTAQGDLQSLRLAQGLELSYLCFLILCLFGSRQYEEFPWLMFALSGALLQLSRSTLEGKGAALEVVQVPPSSLAGSSAGGA